MRRPVGAAKNVLGELVTDGKARNAIVAGITGLAAAPVTKGWTAATAGYAVAELGRSIMSGHKAQQDALADTVGWVNARTDADRRAPTLDAAYRHYQLALQQRARRADGELVGTAPWTSYEFYTRLRGLGL